MDLQTWSKIIGQAFDNSVEIGRSVNRRFVDCRNKGAHPNINFNANMSQSDIEWNRKMKY